MDAIAQYMEISKLLRSIVVKSHDADVSIQLDSDAARPVIRYVNEDIRTLMQLWPDPHNDSITELQKAAEKEDFDHVITVHVPRVAHELELMFGDLRSRAASGGIEGLLHPEIIRSSYRHFREGHYRDAVLNAMVAVFDLIRKRTGLDTDGASLIAQALSLDAPLLVLSTLDNESGRNEQKGFIQILQGAYLAIRNPKAHSLVTDLTEANAAQYLVFASLLARRIEEARIPQQHAT